MTTPVASAVPQGALHRHNRIKLGIACVVGLVAAFLVPIPRSTEVFTFRALTGFIVATGLYSVSTLVHIMRIGPEQTRAHVHGLGSGRTEVDLVVLLGSFGALAAIGFMLVGGDQHKPAATTALESLVTIAAIATAWLCIHTGYTLRYAKHFYNNEPQCIDFNTTTPQFSDFAYLAFDLGMTYQVSDTTVRTSTMRRIVWGHTLLSYVFGTCIVASAINLVIGLASSGGGGGGGG